MALIANLGPKVYGLFRATVSLPNNSIHCTGGSPEMPLSGSFAVIVLGSLHFAAWGYGFLTRTERIFWRASTVLTITVVPVMSTINLLDRKFKSTFISDSPGQWVSAEHAEVLSKFLQFYILLPLFIAARIFILVKVIRSLAYQPPGSYKTTWAAYVPHVG